MAGSVKRAALPRNLLGYSAMVESLSILDGDALLKEIGVELPDCFKPVTFLSKVFCYWSGRNDRYIDRAYREVFEGWVIENRLAIAAQLTKHQEFAERLDALETRVNDAQFERVRRNYGFEAAREAIDDRRRMLAYADAGSVTLELTVAQIARVERTIRELDPEDVKVLAAIKSVPAPRPCVGRVLDEVGQELHSRRLSLLREHDPSGYILQSSGCLEVNAPRSVWSTDQLCVVTKIGDWVLAVLEVYLHESQS